MDYSKRKELAEEQLKMWTGLREKVAGEIQRGSQFGENLRNSIEALHAIVDGERQAWADIQAGENESGLYAPLRRPAVTIHTQ